MNRNALIVVLSLAASTMLGACSGAEGEGAAGSTAQAITLNESRSPVASDAPDVPDAPTTDTSASATPATSTTTPTTTAAPVVSTTSAPPPVDRCGTSASEISSVLGRTAVAGNAVEATPGLMVCGYTLDDSPTGILVTVADETKPGGANFYARLLSTTCRPRTDIAPETCQVIQGESISVATKVADRTVATAIMSAGPNPQVTADLAIQLVRNIATR